MTRARAALALASLLLLPAASLATEEAAPSSPPPHFARLLPADTFFAILLEDFPRTRASWPESPLGRVWADPRITRFFAPAWEELEADRWEERTREGTGHSLSEILDVLGGQVAFVFRDTETFTSLVDPESESFGDGLAALAAIGDRSAIVEELMALDFETSYAELEEGSQAEQVEEEFQGETLHVARVLSPDGVEEGACWAIVEGVYLSAQPKSFLQELVAALKNAPEGSSLADTRAFRRMRSRNPSSDLTVYVNFATLVPEIHEAIGAYFDSAGPNPAGATAETFIRALGLDAIESLYFTADLEAEASRLEAGLLHKGVKGLLRLLAVKPGPVELPDFVPEDALSAYTLHFSLPEAWSALKRIVFDMVPSGSPLFAMQMTKLNEELGFDLEESLVSSLGEKIVRSLTFRPPEQPGETTSIDALDDVYAISVVDRQTLEMTLEGLKERFAPGMELFDEQEFLGTTLHVLKEPLPAEIEGGPESYVAYALTDEYLLISNGSTAGLETVLSRLRKPGRTPWQRPAISGGLKKLPAGSSSLGFADLASLLDGLFTLFIRYEGLAEDESEIFWDAEAKPDLRYLRRHVGAHVEALYSEEGGFFYTTRLLSPGER